MHGLCRPNSSLVPTFSAAAMEAPPLVVAHELGSPSSMVMIRDLNDYWILNNHTVRDDIAGRHPIGGIFILYTPWGGRIRFAFRR